jgi:hypothetical protein
MRLYVRCFGQNITKTRTWKKNRNTLFFSKQIQWVGILVQAQERVCGRSGLSVKIG